MVRDDLFFIQKWIEYYGQQLGRSNLYVLVHGNSSKIRQLCDETNFINVPTRDNDTVGKEIFNRDRFNLINNLANSLVDYHEYVIVTDADEFLIPDPDKYDGILDLLRSSKGAVTISGLGLDVCHHQRLQTWNLDLDDHILKQRYTCKVEPLYTKPAITNKKITRARGNHYSNDPALFIHENLYMFHLKYMDADFALGNHRRRHHLRRGEDLPIIRRPEEGSGDFDYRAGVSKRFERIAELPVSQEFDFSHYRYRLQKSWRRRRYLFQQEFWNSLRRGRLADYSFHWRFDLIREDVLYEIPSRFRKLL